MVRTKRDHEEVYQINGTNKVVRGGDCVLIKSTEKEPYVARVDKIETDDKNEVNVKIRWYYKPEDTVGGRRRFHGSKELFFSDHVDVQSAHTIEGKCNVYTFTEYNKLEDVKTDDYYSRFNYKPTTGTFVPERVTVYCKCELPYNPDDFMIQCDGCNDWYHPDCVGICIDKAKKLDQFVCEECIEYEAQEAVVSSPSRNGKVESKRQKR